MKAIIEKKRFKLEEHECGGKLYRLWISKTEKVNGKFKTIHSKINYRFCDKCGELVKNEKFGEVKK